MEQQLSLLLLLLGSLLSVETTTGKMGPYFSRPPINRYQFLGSDTTFYCSGVHFDLVSFKVNGTIVQAPYEGTQSQFGYNETYEIRHATLIVPGWNSYHRIPLICVGVTLTDDMSLVKMSDRATLQIQGPPGVIREFDGYDPSNTEIEFTWTPPPHLPDLEPCCDYYRINISHMNSSDLIYTSNETQPNVTFSIDPYRRCDVLRVSIIAANRVGEGEEYIQNWSLGGYFKTRTANTTLYYDTSRNMILDIAIRIFGYCLSDLNNVTFSLTCPSKNKLVTVRQIDASPTAESHMTRLQLVIPITHHDTECMWDIALDNTVDFRNNIRTHDIINANVTSTGPGYICISILQFLLNSSALGFTTTLTLVDGNYTINDRISGDYGCSNISMGGEFDVYVYDWNFGGTIATEPAVTIEGVIIPPPPPSPPPPSPSPTDATVDSSVAIIAGSVSVGVIVIISAIGIIGTIILICYCYQKQKYKALSLSHRNSLELKRPIEADYGSKVEKPCSLGDVFTKEDLVRLAKSQAEQFFDTVEVGGKIHVDRVVQNDCLVLTFSV